MPPSSIPVGAATLPRRRCSRSRRRLPRAVGVVPWLPMDRPTPGEFQVTRAGHLLRSPCPDTSLCQMPACASASCWSDASASSASTSLASIPSLSVCLSPRRHIPYRCLLHGHRPHPRQHAFHRFHVDLQVFRQHLHLARSQWLLVFVCLPSHDHRSEPSAKLFGPINTVFRRHLAECCCH